MRIAVTTQSFQTTTGNVGRAQRFMAFEAYGFRPALEKFQIDLEESMAMRDYDPLASTCVLSSWLLILALQNKDNQDFRKLTDSHIPLHVVTGNIADLLNQGMAADAKSVIDNEFAEISEK